MVRFKDRSRTIKVHREILKAFRPNKLQNKLECHHKNGIKDDNNIKNLEWVTKNKNIELSFKEGLQDNFLAAAKDIRKKARKMKAKHLIWAKVERELKLTSYEELAKILNVHKKTLITAMQGKTYKELYELCKN